MTPLELRKRLEDAWCRETAFPKFADEWSPDLPSLHQCHPTSILVRELFGGHVLVGEAVSVTGQKVRAYFNKLPDGAIIDLTADQYGGTVPYPVCEGKYAPVKVKNKRYELLRERLESGGRDD